MGNGISLKIDGSLGTITLDRPDVGNAIDIPMARALLEAAVACEHDPAIRCVILTGAGRFFCTGGDVAGFAAAADALSAHLQEITSYLHAAMVRLARMPKPVLGAINGPAAGAGIGLSIVGDIVLADPKAQFSLSYTGIGMSPDGGATWLLPRLVGVRRAQELCLRNTRVSAEEAVLMGLITRVADNDALEVEAKALARELAAGATSALGATRRLLLDSATASFESHLESESRSIAALARTADGREGIAAFVGKRKPHFGAED